MYCTSIPAESPVWPHWRSGWRDSSGPRGQTGPAGSECGCSNKSKNKRIASRQESSIILIMIPLDVYVSDAHLSHMLFNEFIIIILTFQESRSKQTIVLIFTFQTVITFYIACNNCSHLFLPFSSSSLSYSATISSSSSCSPAGSLRSSLLSWSNLNASSSSKR